jgi:hypothetical protein
MDAKRLTIGTVVGGVVLFATGYLIFELAFGAFYAANAGSATGVERDPELVWAIALGALSYAALVTLAIGSRASSLNIGAGVKIGAVVGFLIWFTADFTFYGITNIQNLTRTVVDPLLEVVHGGIGGGVIAVVLGKIR